MRNRDFGLRFEDHNKIQLLKYMYTQLKLKSILF